MTDVPRSSSLATRFYGFGIGVIAMVDLVLGALDPTQPLPDGIPERAVFVYGITIFLLLAGAAIVWQRTRAWAAAVLTAYFILAVALLMNGWAIATHPIEYGSFFGLVEGFALGAASLVIFAANGTLDGRRARQLTRAAQIAFALCVFFFGGAHFVYPDATIPLVPKWLPPSQSFWAYATGLFHIAGGVAILTGIRARLAAILLTIMYASFTPLVHIPLLLSDPQKHFFWTENAMNVALVGTVWVIAGSLKQGRLLRQR
jgi:uncharacterized membrane protein